MKRSAPDSLFVGSTVSDHHVPATKIKTKSTSTRTSIYKGVTRHRLTGRFEAHLWDKTYSNNIRNKKGRQVYLGAYDSEEAAAHTFDLAALKYWGPDATLNFPVETYESEVEEMERVCREEYVASLRRRSNGFSRGVSKYRGVARHHHNGRWEARIGLLFGNKYLYLGIYDTQEEAAAAYDRAAIEHRGPNVVTNFDISNYIDPLNNKKGLLIAPRDRTNQQEDEERVLVSNQELHYPQVTNKLSWSFSVDAGGLAPLPDLHLEDNVDFIYDSKDCVEDHGQERITLVSYSF